MDFDTDHNFDSNRNRVDIQVQFASGHWQTIRSVDYVNSQYITRQMEFVKHAHSKSKVRAVHNGITIDILP